MLFGSDKETPNWFQAVLCLQYGRKFCTISTQYGLGLHLDLVTIIEICFLN
jgi:hypothetical protein